MKLPTNDRARFRQSLLQGTLQAEDQLVRHSASRVITAIAKVDLENGDWLDIFDILLRASASNRAREREVGTYLLFSALENLGEAMVHRFPEILAVFSKTIGMYETLSALQLTKSKVIKRARTFAPTRCLA